MNILLGFYHRLRSEKELTLQIAKGNGLRLAKSRASPGCSLARRCGGSLRLVLRTRSE